MEKGEELIEAADSCNLENIKKLLNEGIDVNYQNKEGETALIIAYKISKDVDKEDKEYNISKEMLKDYESTVRLENRNKIMKKKSGLKKALKV
jgi:hypothetical protein